jgi:serine/threonine-protein kinase
VTPEREPKIATAASTKLTAPQPPGESGRPLIEHGPLDDARFAPGHMFASRYRIVNLLGRGAMGEAYRAEDLKLGQPVAIKLLGVGGARRWDVQRFTSEVRLARTISHPNVCRVYDIGEADGWWYVPMELVDGETLQSLLRRIGTLPADKALDFARQLCAGLAAAHDRGVLHRDLKPSNIMVDGRGRIRIMDFGLALRSGEWTIGEIAGTPAYMAPEQMAGERVTEQTDVYALGLVLYELYAGRRLFPVQTYEERDRIRYHRPNGQLLPGVDPEVERIIEACLESDPARRPQSALAIAARLPGGDQLSAAIAEGAVLSPEMVAAAGPRGALHPAQAWALLVGVLVGTLAIATQTHFINVAPADVPKPPAVLAERARAILAGVGAGGDDAERDNASWFDFGDASSSQIANAAASVAPGERRTKATFVYRQSPTYMVPQNSFHFITSADPPSDVPGMATVILDPLGRLIRFSRIPLEAPSADGALTVNWAALFGEAGLNEREFVLEKPGQRSLVPHDTQFGWRRTTAGSGPLRVTAATLDGRVVEFDAIGGGVPAPARDLMSSGRSAAAEAAIWAVFLAIFVGAGVLARYNLRLGRGDRTGAKRLAILVVCLSILSGMLRAHHVPIAIVELEWLLFMTGWALLWGAFAWLIYIGIEPHLRRAWPRTLISWTRLLSGQVRDPLVGRDVLIGMLAGVTVMSILIVRFRLSGRAAPSDTLIRALESLSSTPHFANIAFPYQVATALQFALGGAFLFLLARLIIRKTWLAVALAIFAGIPFVPGGVAPFGWEFALMLAPPLLIAMTFLRIGLLAQFALLLMDLLIRVPLTLDPDAWYFGNSLVVLIGVAALATYSFLVSLGGRPAFGGTVSGPQVSGR